MDIDRYVRLVLCSEAGGAVRSVRIRLSRTNLRLGEMAILSIGGGGRGRNLDCR